MIKAIDAKYCKGGLIQNWNKDDGVMLIVSPDGIVFFKKNDEIIINEFENYSNRYDFLDNSIKKGYYFNCLFEYNKPYLVFRGGKANTILKMFLKDGERTLCYTDSIMHSLGIGAETKDEEIELTREEIEARFNKDAYDFMCLFFDNTNPIYIHSNKSNINFGDGFNFSDEKIIESNFEKRNFELTLIDDIDQILNPDSKRPTEKIERRTIDEIKDLKLYSSTIFNKYVHLLLTVKDGVFNLMWFNIVFVEKDRFRLTYSVVPINIPTKDEIINYARNHEIEMMPDMPEEAFHFRNEEEKLLFGVHKMLDASPQIITGRNQSIEESKKDKSRGRIPKWLRDLRRKK